MPNGKYHRSKKQVKTRPINLRRVGLQFDSGTLVGSWIVPDPDTSPTEFLRTAEDIGYHIALAITRGATGAFFVDMDKSSRLGDAVDRVYK